MNRYERRRLRTIASLAAGDAILDVGCAHLANPYLKAARVVGLDLADMAVAPPYTEHVVGDAFAIDELLPDGRFDTIVLGEFIEHVERPYDLLRLLRGHLAPGGRVVVSTPNPLGLPPVVAEYLLLRRFFYARDHAYYFAPRWVWRLAERSGYAVRRTVGCGVSAYGMWLPAPRSLSYQLVYLLEPDGS